MAQHSVYKTGKQLAEPMEQVSAYYLAENLVLQQTALMAAQMDYQTASSMAAEMAELSGTSTAAQTDAGWAALMVGRMEIMTAV